MGRDRKWHRLPVAAAALLALALALAWPALSGLFPTATTVPADRPSGGSSAAAGGGDSEKSASSPGADSGPGEDVPAAGVWRRQSELAVADEARSVLSAYRDAHDCVLVQAGYLDLLGGTWSCTVQGPGWVDVVVVGADGSSGSRVTTTRMGVSEWAASAAASGVGGSDGT